MTGQDAHATILALFRSAGDGFVSGAQISRALGVSRTAIWKKIEQLRLLGYAIEAVPSKGYRLQESPDLLLAAEVQAELGTERIGREVIYYAETDSTNLRAHELGKAGAEEGTVVLADRQTAGRGRLGRHWCSPGGVNLYASIVVRPPVAPRYASQMTFLSAAAVAQTVSETGGLTATVKWPNDVLVEGRKIAGLLNELDAETERIHYLVLGIGVNLNMQAGQFPDDLRYPATSLLLETGRRVSRLDFVRCLLRHMDRLYSLYLAQGFQPVLAAWQQYFHLVGCMVEVDCQNRRVVGCVQGLDSDGALLLELADGGRERVLAGDVRPL
ncbi:MAG: BirA family transcriptional regulator [Desulfuromonadales bacterium]|jgi:BirA family biotin operon repressor/biotin-[acetyl-CoA-carboxylase] ligase|nr:BirA family transcriptional regulator [Desulfuromonadales bacterium]